MRVLLAEDEPYLAEAIATVLQCNALAVDVVHDGSEALEHLELNDYDVAVLDRDLPGTHGDDVCDAVVARGIPTAVLMLTAAGTLRDRVDGFELGADDYLTKPFEFPELVARIRALGRRPRTVTPPILEVGDIRLNPFRSVVTRSGVDITLTRKEFAVLEVLLAADGGVISAEKLLEKAWDANADPFTNAVRVTISKLRARLGHPWAIQTVPGRGYRVAARE